MLRKTWTALFGAACVMTVMACADALPEPEGLAGDGSKEDNLGGNAGSPPDFNASCDAGALQSPIPDCAPEPLPSTGDPAEDCVRRINQLRWECQCLPPLQRWTEAESCADEHAEYDSTRSPHAGFRDGICASSGFGQNECPGWGSTRSVIEGCLKAMWNEGPGEPFSEHGHYINMTNARHSMVACGFYTTADGEVWAVQNFQ